MRPRRRYLFALVAAAVAVTLLPAEAAASPAVTVVTSGLDSPRGVAFFNGHLIVGEAGHGGTLCVVPTPVGTACVGNSAQISWVNTANGTHTPLATGLYSLNLGPEGVLGVSGLAVSDGRILAQLGGTPQEDFTALGQQQSGRLISVRPDGTWKTVAQVGKFDFNFTTQFPQPPPNAISQGTQEHDSNPYGVMATNDGVYVADAGSNTLDRIGEEGRVKIVVYDPFRFSVPWFPTDAVPTCVVKTEDGLLIGELSGRVLKVNGSTFTVINDALFTHITGCASDQHGNVYFVNMFGSGAPFVTPDKGSNFFIGNVVKYNVESGSKSLLVPALQFPNMDTIGPDGNLYVSVGSICGSTPVIGPPCFGATGGVVKITLPHQSED
jgi:hypothetical protein